MRWDQSGGQRSLHSQVVLQHRRFFLSSHPSPQPNVVTSLGVKAAQSLETWFSLYIKMFEEFKSAQFSKNRHPQAPAWGAGDRNPVSKLMLVSGKAAAHAGLVPGVDWSSPEPPAFVSVGFGTLQVPFLGGFMYKETQELVLFKIFSSLCFWWGYRCSFQFCCCWNPLCLGFFFLFPQNDKSHQHSAFELLWN